jgi:hypothetical protein
MNGYFYIEKRLLHFHVTAIFRYQRLNIYDFRNEIYFLISSYIFCECQEMLMLLR